MLNAVYLERVHRPGNKVVLVHCIELPELVKARKFAMKAVVVVSLYYFLPSVGILVD